MTVEHSTLSGSQLHPSKGVSAASANTFNLISSGANSWTTLYHDAVATASTSSSLSFTSLDNYAAICLSFDDLRFGTSTTYPRLQVSSDNGSTYLSTSIYYSGVNQDGTSGSTSGNTYLNLGIAQTNTYWSGKVWITNFNKAYKSTLKGMMCSNSAGNMGGAGGSNVAIVGVVNSATAWNALQITPSSGTFTSGTITLEGLRS